MITINETCLNNMKKKPTEKYVTSKMHSRIFTNEREQNFAVEVASQTRSPLEWEDECDRWYRNFALIDLFCGRFLGRWFISLAEQTYCYLSFEIFTRIKSVVLNPFDFVSPCQKDKRFAVPQHSINFMMFQHFKERYKIARTCRKCDAIRISIIAFVLISVQHLYKL